MRRSTKSAISDSQIQGMIGAILRGGVILSSAAVAFGGFIYLFTERNRHPNYLVFRNEQPHYGSILHIFKSACNLEGAPIMLLGLVVLIATPIARLIGAAVGFLLEKDYVYVVISLAVLAIIAISMLTNVVG